MRMRPRRRVGARSDHIGAAAEPAGWHAEMQGGAGKGCIRHVRQARSLPIGPTNGAPKAYRLALSTLHLRYYTSPSDDLLDSQQSSAITRCQIWHYSQPWDRRQKTLQEILVVTTNKINRSRLPESAQDACDGLGFPQPLP